MRIMQNSKPQYIWTPSGSGKFSSSSAYLILVRSHLPVCSLNVTSEFWKSLWKLNLNDRLRNFIWKIAWNIIPTKDCLSAVLPYSIQSECPLCKSATDSLQHLLFNCSFARIIWRNSPWPLDSAALNFSNTID